MLNVLKGKGLVWPALMTLLGVALLIALGTWQMQRLAWKQGLLADISARAHGEPVSVARALALERDGKDTEYLRVNAQGRFLHGKELHFYDFDAKFGPGYHVLTPLQLTDGSAVFVNRGYVPLDLKEPGTRAKGQVLDDVQIVGLVRLPRKPGAFTPANDVEKNIWYWRDLGAMTASAFGEDKPRYSRS